VVHSGFLGTLIWALFDAGWDFWPLVSRLMVPTGFMLFGFATWPALRQREGKSSFSKPSYALAVVLAAGMLGAFVQMFQPHPTVAFKGEELPLIPVEPNKAQKTGKTTVIPPAVTASSHSIRLTVTTSKT
jgi:quinate dehydrogenase (quinone)